MSTEYELVAVKRRWVPEWLWWLACAYVPTIQFKQLALCKPFDELLSEPPPGGSAESTAAPKTTIRHDGGRATDAACLGRGERFGEHLNAVEKEIDFHGFSAPARAAGRQEGP